MCDTYWRTCIWYCIGMCWYKSRRKLYWVDLVSIFVDQGLKTYVKCWWIVVYYNPSSAPSVTYRPLTDPLPPHHLGCHPQNISLYVIITQNHWYQPSWHHHHRYLWWCVCNTGRVLCACQWKLIRIEQRYHQ